MIKNNNKGFSLIELMVVVGIIGILASVAVPNLLKFQAKAKQSNAKTELSAIYGTQKAFAVEYATYTASLKALGFAPDGVPTKNGCLNVAPSITEAKTGTASNWPVRYYSSGFDQATFADLGKQLVPVNLQGSITDGSASCVVTYARNTVGDERKPLGAVSATTFTAISLGNISTEADVKPDTWEINEAKILKNTTMGF